MSPSPDAQTMSRSRLNLLGLSLAVIASSSSISWRSRAQLGKGREDSSPLLGEGALLCPHFTDEDIGSERPETYPGSQT